MRRGYSTITPAVVHALSRRTLARALGWTDYKQSVTRTQLLDLVLLIAGTTRTLFAVVTRYFGFSHQTARQAVRANLGSRDQLTARLVDALHDVATFTRRDRNRRWTCAIDVHYVPFYGDRSTPGIIGGPKKAGTSFFHAYATCVLINKRRRYTVGLMSVTKGVKPHQQVQTLLDQVVARGLTVRGVVLDAGFDSGETLLLLQARDLNYTVPIRKKGQGTNRRNECYTQPSGTITTMEWVTEKTRQAVPTRVLVWERTGEGAARVYAFRGWGDATAVSEANRARLGRRRYRERFGIETSYRQKNQARGWTTSTDPEYRLLLEGVALLLRQVWVCLTLRIARAQRLAPSAWVAEFPLAEMLDWLTQRIRARYPRTRCITLPHKTLTTGATT
ncbi:transposase [Gemmata sp. JC717]|uniref:transposase n=1 Tax=Gemmata algarum TaxID=2975278 RepID=UPI0021BAAFE0|nr:transposase [Gemmata algarum]MDY3557400.1 transposase [Gemmata algarum]